MFPWLIVVVQFLFALEADALCDELLKYGVVGNITETSPAGALIFNITLGPSETTVDFDIPPTENLDAKYTAALKEYFVLDVQPGSYFVLSLNASLDLEFFVVQFNGAVVTPIKLSFTCTDNYPVIITNDPVNEFDPTFIGAPYNITLNETTEVNNEIFDVKPHVEDTDVLKINHVRQFHFSIKPYRISEFDGQQYFRFRSDTNGALVLDKAIDFDTMTRRWLMLNISVADGLTTDINTRYSTTAMNITVLDADDQYPYFPYPQCSPVCPVPLFKAVIKLEHTGLLQTTPVPMMAVDPDTLGTKLIYSIADGNGYNMFQIDSTGKVTQTKSVRQTGAKESEFRLIIKVRKETHPNLWASAELRVLVEERTPSYNGTDPTGDVKIGSSTEETSDLLIPLIILGVILALLIAAAVIVFLVIRRKQKQMMVEPEGRKSDCEPQTEEEDLHTDRSDEYNTRTDSNEKLVFRGSAGTSHGQGGAFPDGYPATPNGRANQLPPLPLKDSATETMEGTKKKRSRRRNKNKEPEIYDGTREYNMGLDPEFFDSTDKAKVKRSQRSYDKKNDPALWIKVPNDNPADAEY